MIEQLNQFMSAGGDALYLITLLAFIMWTLIFERFWFYQTALRQQAKSWVDRWNSRTEHHSWYAKKIRRQFVSEAQEAIQVNMPLIRTLVALCPLAGLLGTVLGMIDVFHIMAVTGGGDAKAMAGGVSKATIPTMAGMVVALSGVFANTILIKMSEREFLAIEDKLVVDH